MIRLLALCFVVVLLAPAARADFVISNLRFTLYHELGHAVIDQLALPVFGPQENAADSFGLVLADRMHSESELARIITDMTALARLEAEEELFDPWDEYMPGAQRLARAICLYYGLNAEARLETARGLGMPTGSKRGCAEDARATKAAWISVLRRLTPSEGAAPVQSLRAAQRGKALRLLAKDIARINATLVLPRAIPVVQVDCGEDNAFYFDIDERIEFCSEMIDALRARSPG
ncbi:Putative metallopeptidase [Jannaschia faecimaris]|uniref:Putative metallopeptidase n=1 Tax=Jannaschia faecimaris TaxID=1244108 RepID=A0A1H3SWX5_9RHOB|nr:DUF4344 domain-containing metallopeptidase [Jannaschia faecimaris]SDZ42516.1 Putative metallopeptidase [Jannaschia faecimaris]